MEDLRYNDFREQGKQSEWDLNTPGLLVHGIRDPRRSLERILKEGIKPHVRQGILSRINNVPVKPYVVSLSMVGKEGFLETATTRYGYGASELFPDTYRATLVLDQTYIETHTDDFVAVGDYLGRYAKPHLAANYEGVRDMFKYQGSRMSYFDEIECAFVPPEALAAIVVHEVQVPTVQEQLRRARSSLPILDLTGQRYPIR